MATLNLAEFLKEQQTRLEQGRQYVGAARKSAETGKEVPPEIVRDSQKRELESLRAQLARTEAARQQALARYDGEIARVKDAIARLEEDGKKTDEVLTGGRPRPIRGGGGGRTGKPAAAKVAAGRKKGLERGAKR